MKHSFYKLTLYKTAWSPQYKEFVGIRRVYRDADGNPLIKAHIAFTPESHLIIFRPHELTNYVL